MGPGMGRRGVKDSSWGGGPGHTAMFLAQQRSKAARISSGQGDLATLRCSLAHQRGEAARISLGEGDLASLRCYSWAEGYTDHCSWAEGGYTDCCSSSMATTLGLLWGRMEEMKEIDEMTTYAQLPRH